MPNANTLESPEEALDYKKTYENLIEQRNFLYRSMETFPEDRILPLLARIATINLKILKIHQNENKSKHTTL